MNEFTDRIKETLSRLASTAGGGKIICAVSGGPDSVAMLLMLREELPVDFELALAHFDHRIREGSGGDADWVRDLAAKLGVPCYVGEDDVPERSGILHLNMEETARDSRRDFLRRLARDVGAVRIALGHNRDDRAATVLMHLIRGAGEAGLGGMAEDGGLFWRPVMGYRKSELVEYLTDNSQDYLLDCSNDDLSLTRNRIEQVVLPELREINPGILSNILAASEIVKEQYEYIEEFADSEYGKLIKTSGGGIFIEEAFSLPDVVFKTLLRKGYSAVDPSNKLQAAHYAAVLRLDDKEITNLPGRITAKRDGLSLYLAPVKLPKLAFWRAEVPGVGKRYILDIGIRVTLSEDTAPADLPGQRANVAWFRKGTIAGSIIIRSRRPGDYFYPSGGNGKRKLKKYLIDERIPRELRSDIPIVESNGRIIWVVGHRIAEGVVAAPGEEAFRISVEQT
ncbi:MAG: tRNA lysidine(34) synthetase TilS [bacterium]|nr:tRNA lysidine(34) synthetase TilS [bacterium]